MIHRTVYCDEHKGIEAVASIRRHDKFAVEPNAKGQVARMYYGTTDRGCKVAFVSSLTWRVS